MNPYLIVNKFPSSWIWLYYFVILFLWNIHHIQYIYCNDDVNVNVKTSTVCFGFIFFAHTPLHWYGDSAACLLLWMNLVLCATYKRRSGKIKISNVEPPSKIYIVNDKTGKKIYFSKQREARKTKMLPYSSMRNYFDYLIHQSQYLLLKYNRPHGIANACFRWFGNTLIKYPLVSLYHTVVGFILKWNTVTHLDIVEMLITGFIVNFVSHSHERSLAYIHSCGTTHNTESR